MSKSNPRGANPRGAKSQIIHIRASDDELEAAKLVAETRGQTVSQLGRDLILDAFYSCLDEQMVLAKLKHTQSKIL